MSETCVTDVLPVNLLPILRHGRWWNYDTRQEQTNNETLKKKAYEIRLQWIIYVHGRVTRALGEHENMGDDED